jgi:electron transfer flavoprotein beta subunit
MKAKKKPMQTLSAQSLGVDVTPHVTLIRVDEPAGRKGGGRVADVKELVA